MNKYPVPGKIKQIQKPDQKKVEVVEPLQNRGSFISFNYSYKSMTYSNGKTHVHSKTKCFKNGRLESEEFSGIMDGNVWMHSAAEIQSQFFKQITNLFKPLTMFLPFSVEEKDKKEK